MKTGQRVVCIKPSNWWLDGIHPNATRYGLPVQNTSYTVTESLMINGVHYISLDGFDFNAGFDVEAFSILDENWTEEICRLIEGFQKEDKTVMV
jgi:hypothetical protein